MRRRPSRHRCARARGRALARLLAAAALATPLAAQEPWEEPAPGLEAPASEAELLDSSEAAHPEEPPSLIRLAAPAQRLAGLRPDRSALLLTGAEGGGLLPRIAAVPWGEEGQQVVWQLVVELPGGPLLAAGAGAPELPLEILAMALDSRGRVAGHLAQRLTVDLARRGPELLAGGVRFTARLDLPPGDHTLRVLAFDPGGRHYGLRELPLPRAARGGGTAGPVILVPGAEEGWELFRQAPAPGDPGPQAILPDPYRPLPLSELQVTEPTELEAWLLLPAAAGFRRPAVHLLDANGRYVQTLETVEAGPGQPAPGRAELRPVRVRLPALAAGVYGLQVGVVAPVAEIMRPGERPMGDLLGPDGRPAGEVFGPPLPIWVPGEEDLRVVTIDSYDPGEDLGQRRRRRRARLDQSALAVADGYRQALSSLAQGEQGAALASLAELERGSVASSGDPVAPVRQGQLAVLQDLAEADPENLLPLLLLHLDLHRQQGEALQVHLAFHAQRMTATLATLHAERLGTEAARQRAAHALALLGAALRELRMDRQAAEVLAKAVELDPANRTALLAAAVVSERTGGYREALRHLERLRALDPTLGEARLRQAVNLRRLGRGEEARRLLERLVAESHPDWVLSLAYQELAQGLETRGELAEAEMLLRDGVRRLPRQQGLRIALAYVVDRQGRPEEARELAEEALALPPTRQPTPRLRYGLVGPEELQRSRELLAAAALARLPQLATALEDISR